MKSISRRLACVILAISSLFSCGKKSEPFVFVQISDPQIGFGDNLEVSTKDWFIETVNKINEIHPDFVVCTGDMTHEFKKKEQMAVFDSLLACVSPDIQVYFVPGNHDYRTEWPGSREFYAEHFGSNRFSFVHKGTLFLGYDSNIIGENLVEQEAEQYGWMVEQFKKYGKKADHILVFQHCPVVADSLDEEEAYFNFHAPYRQKYLDLFSEYGVDIVFSGHKHYHAHLNYKDVQYVTCPASGIPLGNDSKGAPHFRGMNVVKVTPDTVEWKATTVDAAVNPLKNN